MGKKVVVGMSGGVDSSVAAYLLKEQGYEVIGVTMQIWQSETQCEVEKKGGCCGISAVEDARRVAEVLDIPYYVMNFRAEFKRDVIDYFVREYRLGRTPNPCIACNRYVKWEALLTRSLMLGADYIATGHYARVLTLENGRYALASSKTAAKDQSYALYNLTQRQLAHTLMPIGEYEKPEVRAIAAAAGLPVASKPDSQEICFVPDGDYARFIDESTGETALPGKFVRADGTVLGEHKGLTHYTVGQRKGLGIAFGEPMYVVELRPESNEVVLGTGDEVYAEELLAGDVNWMAVAPPPAGEILHCRAKIRYNHGGAACRVTVLPDGKIRVAFPTPQRAVTPGQAVVLYTDSGAVLGGGTIEAE